MQKVVQLELQISGCPALVLLDQLLLRLANQSQVAVLVEVVVGLQQDNVLTSLGLLVVELQNGLQVLLLEVLLL